MNRARVLIADDHPLVCDALRAMLEPTCEVVEMIYDGRKVVEAVCRLAPDLLLLDVSLPGRNGLEIVRELGKLDLPTRIVMLTMHVEPLFAEEAMRAGAEGYLVKSTSGPNLIAAIAQVLDGGTVIDPSIGHRANSQNWIPEHPTADAAGDPLYSLTERQRDVLIDVARGLKNSDIAERLGISTKAVEFHRTRLKRVLGVSSTAGLVRFAVSRGLIEPRSSPGEPLSEPEPPAA
jgi:DNA-binding NarL/FixJ family response regulator